MPNYLLEDPKTKERYQVESPTEITDFDALLKEIAGGVEPGFFSDLWAGTKGVVARGALGAAQTVGVFDALLAKEGQKAEVYSKYAPGVDFTEQIERNRQREQSALGAVAILEGMKRRTPHSAAQAEFAHARNREERWAAWKKNPVEITASVVGESLPASITGAMLGAPLGPGGMAAGVGLSSYALTLSSELIGAGEKAGFKMNNPVEFNRYVQSPKFDEDLASVQRKAAVVGGIDAATAGTAGMIVGRTLKSGVMARLLGVGAETGVQMAGGGGGEVLGSYAAGQEPESLDVLLEMAGEAVSPELAPSVYEAIRKPVTDRAQEQEQRVAAEEERRRIQSLTELRNLTGTGATAPSVGLPPEFVGPRWEPERRLREEAAFVGPRWEPEQQRREQSILDELDRRAGEMRAIRRGAEPIQHGALEVEGGVPGREFEMTEEAAEIRRRVRAGEPIDPVLEARLKVERKQRAVNPDNLVLIAQDLAGRHRNPTLRAMFARLAERGDVEAIARQLNFKVNPKAKGMPQQFMHLRPAEERPFGTELPPGFREPPPLLGPPVPPGFGLPPEPARPAPPAPKPSPPTEPPTAGPVVAPLPPKPPAPAPTPEPSPVSKPEAKDATLAELTALNEQIKKVKPALQSPPGEIKRAMQSRTLANATRKMMQAILQSAGVTPAFAGVPLPVKPLPPPPVEEQADLRAEMAEAQGYEPEEPAPAQAPAAAPPKETAPEQTVLTALRERRLPEGYSLEQAEDGRWTLFDAGMNIAARADSFDALAGEIAADPKLAAAFKVQAPPVPAPDAVPEPEPAATEPEPTAVAPAAPEPAEPAPATAAPLPEPTPAPTPEPAAAHAQGAGEMPAEFDTPFPGMDVSEAEREIAKFEAAVKPLDREMSEIRDHLAALKPKVEITRGRKKGFIKASAKRAEVEAYRSHQRRMEQIIEEHNRLAAIVKPFRQRRDAQYAIDAANNRSLPTLTRLTNRQLAYRLLNQEQPFGLDRAISDAARFEILKRFPDASEAEVQRLEHALTIRSNAQNVDGAFKTDPALDLNKLRHAQLWEAVQKQRQAPGTQVPAEAFPDDLRAALTDALPGWEINYTRPPTTGRPYARAEVDDLKARTQAVTDDWKAREGERAAAEAAERQRQAEATSAADQQVQKLVEEAQAEMAGQPRGKASAIKKELQRRVADALAVAPVNMGEGGAASRVVIAVPGDGIFVVLNTQATLAKLAAKVKSLATDIPTGKIKRESLDIEPANIPKKPLTGGAAVEELEAFLSTDKHAAPFKQAVWSDGSRAVATDGKVVVSVTGSFPKHDVEGFPLEVLDSYLNADERREAGPVEISTDELWRVGRMAENLEWGTGKKRTSSWLELRVNPDGSLHATSKDAEGDTATWGRKRNGATRFGTLNAETLWMLANAARWFGHGTVTMQTNAEVIDPETKKETVPATTVFKAAGFEAVAAHVKLPEKTAAAPEAAAEPAPEAQPGETRQALGPSDLFAGPPEEDISALELRLETRRIQRIANQQGAVPGQIRVIYDPTRTQDGFVVRMEYDLDTGVITVNSAFMPETEPELASLLRHEIAHHALNSQEGQAVLDRFTLEYLTDDVIAGLAAKGYVQQPGETAGDYRLRMSDEFIAQQAEANSTLWQRMVDSVKAWLEHLGIRNLTSEEAARVLLREVQSRRAQALRGGGYPASRHVRFSLGNRADSGVRTAAAPLKAQATAEDMDLDEAADIYTQDMGAKVKVQGKVSGPEAWAASADQAMNDLKALNIPFMREGLKLVPYQLADFTTAQAEELFNVLKSRIEEYHRLGGFGVDPGILINFARQLRRDPVLLPDGTAQRNPLPMELRVRLWHIAHSQASNWGRNLGSLAQLGNWLPKVAAAIDVELNDWWRDQVLPPPVETVVEAGSRQARADIDVATVVQHPETAAVLTSVFAKYGLTFDPETFGAWLKSAWGDYWSNRDHLIGNLSSALRNQFKFDENTATAIARVLADGIMPSFRTNLVEQLGKPTTGDGKHGQHKPHKPTVTKIQRIVKRGVTDITEITKELAREEGYRILTPKEIEQMKTWAAQVHAMDTLNPTEKQAAVAAVPPGDIEAVKDAFRAALARKRAAMATARRQIMLKMVALYGKLRHPAGFRRGQRLEMFSQINDLATANMLFTTVFPVKQTLDVFSQMTQMGFTRPFGNAWARSKQGQPFLDVLAREYMAQFGQLKWTFGSKPGFKMFGHMIARGWKGEQLDRRFTQGFERHTTFLERIHGRMAQAREEKDSAKYWGNWFLSIIGTGFYVSGVFDQVATHFSFLPELRSVAADYLIRQDPNLTAREADIRAQGIVYSAVAEVAKASFQANQIADLSGMPWTEHERRQMTWNLLEQFAIEAVHRVGVTTGAVEEAQHTMRTINWNEPEKNGVGGVVMSAGRKIARWPVVGILSRFSNAAAITINRSLHWAGGGFHTTWQSPWYNSERDRGQRKIESIVGLTAGTGLGFLIAFGLARVIGGLSDDKGERERELRQGRRPYSIEFDPFGTGKPWRIGLSSGPLANLRVPLLLVGSVFTAREKELERITRLHADADRRGVEAKVNDQLGVLDLAQSIGAMFFMGMASGRTISGLLNQFYNPFTKQIEMLKIMGGLGSAVPGVPMIRSLERLGNIQVDRKLIQNNGGIEAVLTYFLTPTVAGWLGPGQVAKDFPLVNFFGDSLVGDGPQQIADVFTGGTFGRVDPALAKQGQAYQMVGRAGFVPAPLATTAGVYHLREDMKFGPLDPKEYARYLQTYGATLKKVLNALPAETLTLDPTTLAQVIRTWEVMAETETLLDMGYQKP